MKFPSINKKLRPVILIGGIICIILLAYIAMIFSDMHRINSMYSEGLRQQNLKNYQQAVDIFKELGIRYWGSTISEKAMIRVAEIYYYDINNYRLAADTLEKLIQKSEHSELLVQEKIMLAGIYSDQMNRHEDALRLLEEADKMEVSKEDRLSILLTNAKVCQKLEKFESAAGYYENALKLCAEARCIIDVKIKLAACYTSLFERPKAEGIFHGLLIMPQLTEEQRYRIEWQLFQNLDEQDRFEEALKVVIAMLDRDPTNEILINEKKRIQEEIDFIRQAIRKAR